MIDYHIHTSLCNHAQGEMEDYVAAAIEKKLVEICFLDHLILHKEGKHSSMNLKELPLYFAETQRLKNKYRDKIKVKVGLEVDFDPQNIDIIENLLAQYSFDAIGSSVHFINGINIASRREAAKTCEKNDDYLIEKYFQTLYKMLDYCYFDFICHFDVIKKNGREIPNKFKSLIDDIISKIAVKNIAVEINTGGWQHPANECYPSPGIIQKCIDADIPILLSSDAHKPEDVGNNFEKAIRILSSFGCRKISSFNKRKIKFTTIATL